MIGTIHRWRSEAIHTLKRIHPDGEARAIVMRLLEHCLGLRETDLILLDKDRALSSLDEMRLSAYLCRLETGEPLQYVLGATSFYGCDIAVAPGVLIPRPETEELVDIIVRTHRHSTNMSILDLCTGSGCIPIALARTLDSTTHLRAIELSPEAIAIAQSNVDRLGHSTQITIQGVDIFTLTAEDLPERYNIIVSNPPYIHPDESKLMHASVLEHEPEMALFAPSSNPLAFYEAIARLALEVAKPEGQIYVELNPHYASETLVAMGRILSRRLERSELIVDMSGKERFAHFSLL